MDNTLRLENKAFTTVREWLQEMYSFQSEGETLFYDVEESGTKLKYNLYFDGEFSGNVFLLEEDLQEFLEGDYTC